MSNIMTQPTHFIEVWKGKHKQHIERVKDIDLIDDCLKVTRNIPAETLFIWKIKPKTNN